eukprot:g41246.t1
MKEDKEREKVERQQEKERQQREKEEKKQKQKEGRKQKGKDDKRGKEKEKRQRQKEERQQKKEAKQREKEEKKQRELEDRREKGKDEKRGKEKEKRQRGNEDKKQKDKKKQSKPSATKSKEKNSSDIPNGLSSLHPNPFLPHHHKTLPLFHIESFLASTSGPEFQAQCQAYPLLLNSAMNSPEFREQHFWVSGLFLWVLKCCRFDCCVCALSKVLNCSLDPWALGKAEVHF